MLNNLFIGINNMMIYINMLYLLIDELMDMISIDQQILMLYMYYMNNDMT